MVLQHAPLAGLQHGLERVPLHHVSFLRAEFPHGLLANGVRGPFPSAADWSYSSDPFARPHARALPVAPFPRCVWTSLPVPAGSSQNGICGAAAGWQSCQGNPSTGCSAAQVGSLPPARCPCPFASCIAQHGAPLPLCRCRASTSTGPASSTTSRYGDLPQMHT